MTNDKFIAQLEPIYDFMKHISIPTNRMALNSLISTKTIPPYMFITQSGESELQLVKQIVFFLQMADYLNQKHELGLEFLADSIMDRSQSVLIDKNKEYSDGKDRFSNFHTAVKYMPYAGNAYEAVVAISSKHFAWVEDALFDRIEVTEKGIYDHIVDAINYIFIYYSMQNEEFPAC
jgi:hypothetical protein